MKIRKSTIKEAFSSFDIYTFKTQKEELKSSKMRLRLRTKLSLTNKYKLIQIKANLVKIKNLSQTLVFLENGKNKHANPAPIFKTTNVSPSSKQHFIVLRNSYHGAYRQGIIRGVPPSPNVSAQTPYVLGGWATPV